MALQGVQLSVSPRPPTPLAATGIVHGAGSAALRGVQAQTPLFLGTRRLVSAVCGTGAATLAAVHQRQKRRKIQRQAAAENAKEEDGLAKFLDRWNTRGGAIVLFTLMTVGVFALKAFIEFAGVDSNTSGLWVSGGLSILLVLWTIQYITRVFDKSTTYVEQLKEYEKNVIMKRLSELTEEEIIALCAEVGVTDKDLNEVYGQDKVEALSRKEKVLELFNLEARRLEADPRDFMAGKPAAAQPPKKPESF